MRFPGRSLDTVNRGTVAAARDPFSTANATRTTTDHAESIHGNFEQFPASQCHDFRGPRSLATFARSRASLLPFLRIDAIASFEVTVLPYRSYRFHSLAEVLNNFERDFRTFARAFRVFVSSKMLHLRYKYSDSGRNRKLDVIVR